LPVDPDKFAEEHGALKSRVDALDRGLADLRVEHGKVVIEQAEQRGARRSLWVIATVVPTAIVAFLELVRTLIGAK